MEFARLRILSPIVMTLCTSILLIGYIDSANLRSDTGRMLLSSFLLSAVILGTAFSWVSCFKAYADSRFKELEARLAADLKRVRVEKPEHDEVTV